MEIRLCASLDPADWEAWRQLHLQQPHLDSPCFHPRFAQGLIAAGHPVEVAIVRRQRCVVALYGFERHGRHGRPMGWPMNDFQAILSAPETEFDERDFLAAAGLRTLRFDHALADDNVFSRHAEAVRPSPYMDVSGGMEAYRMRLEGSARETLSTTLRLSRKAARELGPLRFEFHCEQSALLDRLIEWKRAQYRATGTGDFLAQDRPRTFLRWLMGQPSGGEFGGVLSATWAGEHLLALHAGMRAGGVLHWWFPSYDPTYSSYAPGRLMLAQLAEHAVALGLRRIDLGKGDEVYKQRCMTGATAVAEGVMDTRVLHRAWRRYRRSCTDALRESALYGRLRAFKRRLRSR